jgi:hypothetical protein
MGELIKFPERVGKAYGFFESDASRPDIEAELPYIREEAQTPSKVVLSLYDGTDKLKSDPELSRFMENTIMIPIYSKGLDDSRKTARPVRMKDSKYLIEAEFPGADDRKAASELALILDYIHYSFSEKEYPLIGNIAYKENGRYALWD